MHITIRGVLAADVANAGTLTVSLPTNGSDLKSFQADFPVTGGDFYGNAINNRLSLNGGDPLTSPVGFDVTTLNASTVVITNRSGAAWKAGASYVLQLEMSGYRYYQDNDPNYARKKAKITRADTYLVNLGMPAAASASAVASIASLTTSAVGIEKLTAPVYLDVPRAVSITSAAAGDTSAFSAKITGTDQYGATVSETIAFNGAATVNGNKAFSVVTSIKLIHASGTAMTGAVTVGTTTKLGLPVFVANATAVVKESLNGAAATAGTFAYGLTTAGGSTATTGDVRGTYIPNSAPNGSNVYQLLLSLSDPGNLGAPQFAG